jgi:hypothetical protein
MKNKRFLKLAGLILLATTFLHLFAGQVDLVDPLLDTSLSDQQKAEWVSVWHMITMVLLFSTIYTLRIAFSTKKANDLPLRLIGYLFVLMSLPFIVSGFWFGLLAPQWILLLPTGLLIIYSTKENV